jgi:hypothetical protein
MEILHKPLDSAVGNHLVIGEDTVRSFLPLKMLRKDVPSTATAISFNIVNEEKNKKKVGWSCCIDCVDLRGCLDWEFSHGALYLVRELAKSSSALDCFERGNGTVLSLLTDRCLSQENLRQSTFIIPNEADSNTFSIIEGLWKILLYNKSMDGVAVQVIKNLDKIQIAIYDEVMMHFRKSFFFKLVLLFQ